MRPQLIIFDFDGVVADSEVIACTALAAYATELGAPMSADHALRYFTGRRVGDVKAAIEQLAGRPINDFIETLLARTLEAFSIGLREVEGFSAFLAAHQDVPRCIASSSSHERIEFCLSLLHLTSRFDGRIISADDVPRGKPFPDIFLEASRRMGVSPADAVVIEDSAGGVRAGVAAGIPVIGLVAASHLGEENVAILRDAGAAHVARSYAEISELLSKP